MKNLYIVGTVPESSFIGGVSIHVKRLTEALDIKKINYALIDYKQKGVKKTCLFLIRHKGVVHIHVTHPILLLMFLTASKLAGSKCIFTLHADYERFSGWKKLAFIAALKCADVPILINHRSYEACRKISRNALFIPVFIPPYVENTLQPEIVDKITEQKEKGKTIVSTNASRLSFDRFGNEIYGIAFLVDFFKEKKQYALIISDPKGAYRQHLKETGDNIIFIDYPHPYYELLKHIDIFVRNTSTDGDAISVKEALYLGKRALCSDSVDRPLGVTLFSYSNRQSFEDALQSVLKTQAPDNMQVQDCAIEIIDLYRKTCQ